MKKFDFVNFAKFVLIGVLVIIVAGLAILGFLGFNKHAEYKGGYEVVVEAEEVYGDLDEKLKDASVNAISSLKINYSSLKQIDEGRIVVFTVNSALADDFAENMKTQLGDAIPASISVEVTVNQITVYEGVSQIWWAILSVGILFVCAFLYFLFRYKIASALSYLISCVAQVLLLVALTCASRVVVTSSFMTVVLASIALITLFAVPTYAKVREQDKTVGNNLSSKEKVNQATVSNLLPLIIVVAFLIVLSIVMILLGSNSVVWTAIQIILMAITVAITSLFINSGCYAFLKKESK